MSLPSLSFCVVTPSFQQGRFIERTIESVLGQGLDGFEYVVMDGGSRDETVAILERYGDRLRFVSESDDGQADAVNRGIASTSGEIIGWINSDDVYRNGALRAVERFFAGHPEVDVVYGRADHIDAEDRVLEPYPTEPWDLARLNETCFLCQPATFFRRRVIERWGDLDADLRYCMDYEYWLRLATGGARFAFLDRTLAGSRLYGETKTLGERRAVHREINDMFRRTVGVVPDRWVTNWAHSVLEGGRLSLAETPARFAITVSALSLFAALRWNRRIGKDLRQLTAGWVRGNVKLFGKGQAPPG